MKTVRIGPVDGEQASFQVEDNATIAQALAVAGLRMAPSQSITSFSDAQDISLGEMVRDGETYLLTGNQVSGQ